jgi:PAS domain S-box-containing protein
MNGISQTKQRLLTENRELKVRLAESENTLEAIRTGAVDALVVSDAHGERIFTLQSVDYGYRVMAETISEGAVIIDNAGIIVFANRAFSNLTGKEMPTLVGARFRDLLASSLPASVSDFLQECTQNSCRGEFSIACAQGAKPVSISGTSFKIGERQNVCLIISDLRERKEAEARLRNAYEDVERKVVERTHELRQREEEFRTLSENSPDSIERFDAELRNLYVNPAAGKISGIAISGKTWREAGYPPDFIAFWEKQLKKVIKTKTPQNVERGYQSPDGTRYILSSTIAPEFDGEGMVRSVLIVSRDITESVRTADALLHNIQQLTAVNKELGSFNLSLTHDLRNPLHAIVSCISLLSNSNKEMHVDDKKAIDYINQMAGRMSLVIKDLLSLSRISTEDMKVTTVLLSAMAQDLNDDIKARYPQHEAEVIIMPGLTALADKSLVCILLENLFQNAWKFSSKCAKARIEFGATRKNGQTVYFVRDNGAGFDRASAGLLFEPFTRFHSREEFPGSGIGLSIVKRIAARHGGTVWAESEPDKGATFFFTLQ